MLAPGRHNDPLHPSPARWSPVTPVWWCRATGSPAHTVGNEVYLLKAGNFFKTVPHYKVTNVVQIQMKYNSEYFEKKN